MAQRESPTGRPPPSPPPPRTPERAPGEEAAPLPQSVLRDIQGLVVHGYEHMRSACFLFLQVEEPAAAAAWLGRVADQVTTAHKRPREEVRRTPCVNLALSAAGLERLGLPAEVLDTFPEEFREGMARRAALLGDSGPSAPDTWELGGEAHPLHAVLMLYAPDPERVPDALIEPHRRALEASGWRVVYTQHAARLLDAEGFGVEPFGFRDGISQPVIRGLEPEADIVARSRPATDRSVAPGELILGFPNESGLLPHSPSVPGALDPEGLLGELPAGAPGAPLRRDLGRHGTYLVLRKLYQDVDAFTRFLDERARREDGSVDEAQRRWLAAKLVGRWQNGAALRPGQRSEPALARGLVDNSFLFQGEDAQGFGCPVTSHVRRSNPRDSLPPDPARSLATVRRHRVMRRGITYRDGDEQGLVFIVLNTSLREQFEFIQQSWMNNEKFGGLPAEKDPVAGDHDGGGTFTIPEEPLRRRLHGLPRFVQTRGGDYFFLPALRALRFLATLGGARPRRVSPR